MIRLVDERAAQARSTAIAKLDPDVDTIGHALQRLAAENA